LVGFFFFFFYNYFLIQYITRGRQNVPYRRSNKKVLKIVSFNAKESVRPKLLIIRKGLKEGGYGLWAFKVAFLRSSFQLIPLKGMERGGKSPNI